MGPVQSPLHAAGWAPLAWAPQPITVRDQLATLASVLRVRFPSQRWFRMERGLHRHIFNLLDRCIAHYFFQMFFFTLKGAIYWKLTCSILFHFYSIYTSGERVSELHFQPSSPRPLGDMTFVHLAYSSPSSKVFELTAGSMTCHWPKSCTGNPSPSLIRPAHSVIIQHYTQ